MNGFEETDPPPSLKTIVLVTLICEFVGTVMLAP